MKTFLAFAAATMFCAGSAWAQKASGPTEQYGFGATLATPTTEVNLSGVQGQYALSNDLHVGAGLGLELASEGSFVSVIPYAKYLFAPMGGFRPYVSGQLTIQKLSSDNLAGNSDGDVRLAFVAGVGAEYFITNNVGLFVTMPVLTLPFRDNATVSFGLLSPTIGMEFFLD